LAVISKILELHVHNSFYHFLTEYDLLVENQFGFRTSRSCELAVTHLTDRILTNIDNKKLNGLLVDFKNAFDLVDHEILILKLRMFGCSPLVLKWFTSYLSDCYQHTYFKNTLSDMRPVKIGVPQGSILGPLLFILFINDLPSQLSHSESTMFADDTTVLTKGSSIHDLNVKLNLVAQYLSTWTQQNQMVTNTLKTKTMLIHSPQQLKNTSDRSLSVILNGNMLFTGEASKSVGFNA
jgi:retron-type reverse transcriptase